MRPARVVGKVVMVLGAAIMSGCYSYVPVERPTPGTVVRIDVPVRSAVTGSRQQPETAALEGTVVSAGDSIVLAMSSTQEIGNFRQIRSADTVRVARADLAGISERSFSKPKTIALTTVITGATVGLALVALGVGGGSQGSGPPGNGPGAAIIVKPIFSALLHALGR
jgi:hypothetical protein